MDGLQGVCSIKKLTHLCTLHFYLHTVVERQLEMWKDIDILVYKTFVCHFQADINWVSDSF